MQITSQVKFQSEVCELPYYITVNVTNKNLTQTLFQIELTTCRYRQSIHYLQHEVNTKNPAERKQKGDPKRKFHVLIKEDTANKPSTCTLSQGRLKPKANYK